jgi:polygalacturonase
LIVLSDCTRVLVRDVTLINSPMFHLVPQRCRDVRIEDVKISAPSNSHNTDGIDPSGWNIYIARCTIDTGDDDIVFKPDHRGHDGAPAVEYALIEKCTILRGHGISVGGQTRGGLENLVVRNCTFDGTTEGIRLKASVGDGGLVENVRFENLSMKNVRETLVFTSWYHKPFSTPTTAPVEPSEHTPVWRNIIVRNLESQGSKVAGRIWGLPNAPIENVAFDNVHIDAERALDLTFADRVTFTNSDVAISAGLPTTAPTTRPLAPHRGS